MSCCRISRSVRTTQTVIAPSTSRVRKCTRRHQSMPTTNCQLASPCMHQLHASRHGTMEPGDVVHQGTAPTPVCTGNCKDKLLNNMISTSCNGSINNRDRHHPTTGCGVGGSGRGGGSGGGGGGGGMHILYCMCGRAAHIPTHNIPRGTTQRLRHTVNAPHTCCCPHSDHITPASTPETTNPQPQVVGVAGVAGVAVVAATVACTHCCCTSRQDSTNSHTPHHPGHSTVAASHSQYTPAQADTL
jgi:hypothetical protein